MFFLKKIKSLFSMAAMRKILIFSNLISKEDCVVGEKWKMLIKSADKIFLKKKSQAIRLTNMVISQV